MLLLCILRCHFHSHPQPPGDELPEEDEKAVAPVDGDDGMVVAYAFGYGEGDAMRVELEWIVVTICQERCAHKSRTNVVKVDVAYASDVAELGQTLEVVIVVALGGRIGWSNAQSTCASNAADDSEMSFLLRMFLKIVEGGINHLCEAHYIRCHRCHFLVDVKGRILITNAGTMEIEIHSPRFADERKETTGCIHLIDVDALSRYHVEVLALNLL